MLRILFLPLFIALIVSGCSIKNEDKSNSDLLLLLFASQDRVENYDRDVQIITHAIIPDSYGLLVYDVNYSDSELDSYRTILQTEMAKYPRGYWIKARAERVVLVKNLRNIALSGQYVAAVPDPFQSVLYLSINGVGGCYGRISNSRSSSRVES